ncbi:MAG: RNA polymerase sigma factor [Polyangiales bacterium]
MSARALRAAMLAVDEEALLARVAQGDAAALGAAFERWHRDVYRALARLRGTRLDLDDLVQTTFLALPDAAKNHQPGGSPRGFVLGVALQCARRERRRVFRRLQLWRAREDEMALLDGPSQPPDPERSALGREHLARFARALAALPVAQRETLLLVEMEGLRGEEAAAALGVPVNTVWTRLHHARAALRAATREDAR